LGLGLSQTLNLLPRAAMVLRPLCNQEDNWVPVIGHIFSHSFLSITCGPPLPSRGAPLTWPLLCFQDIHPVRHNIIQFITGGFAQPAPMHTRCDTSAMCNAFACRLGVMSQDFITTMLRLAPKFTAALEMLHNCGPWKSIVSKESSTIQNI
jgi:hypothetical protein